MALVLQIVSSLNGTAHDRLEYQGAHHSGWHPHRTGRSWFSHPGSISAPKHVTGSMNFANWCIWELLACCLLACCAFVHVCVFVSVSVNMTIYLQYLSIYITYYNYLLSLLSLSLSVRPSVCLSVPISFSLSLSLPPRASVRKCADKCVCVNHLERCKTSNLAGGRWGTLQSAANEDAAMFLWKRTCNFLVFRQWQPAKPRTGMSVFQQFSNYCTVFAIWLSCIRTSKSWEQGRRKISSHSFSLPIIKPFLSGLTEVFLHVRCVPHQ